MDSKHFRASPGDISDTSRMCVMSSHAQPHCTHPGGSRGAPGCLLDVWLHHTWSGGSGSGGSNSNRSNRREAVRLPGWFGIG